MRARFFLRIVQRSFANRLGKWLTAILAVALGTSLVSASLGLAVGMQVKMRQALRAYGANILLVPAAHPGGAREAPGGAQLLPSMSEDVLARLGSLAGDLPLLGYTPLLYTVVEIGPHRVALAGTWPDAVRRVNPAWRMEGEWIEDRDDLSGVVLGTSLAQKLGLTLGAPLTLTTHGRGNRFRVVGILSTGGSEDEQVMVTLRAAQEVSGQAGRLSLIQVSALGADRSVEEIARALESGLPGVEARTQLRLVLAEEHVLARLSLLLSLIAGLVLIASALGVAATMTTSVLERTREIGLMKALGATRSQVGSFFLAEAGAMGLAGGVLGGAAGLLLAQAIAWSIFGGDVPFRIAPAIVSVGMGVCVAALGSLIPIRRAASIHPAGVLRGE